MATNIVERAHPVLAARWNVSALERGLAETLSRQLATVRSAHTLATTASRPSRCCSPGRVSPKRRRTTVITSCEAAARLRGAGARRRDTPNRTAPLLDGGQLSVEELRGRPALFLLLPDWCPVHDPVCDAFPKFQDAYERWKK